MGLVIRVCCGSTWINISIIQIRYRKLIIVNQVKLPVEHTEADIRKKIIKELELRRILKGMPDFSYKVIRRSIDARKRPDIFYIYAIVVDFSKCSDKSIESTILKKCHNKNVSLYKENKYILRKNIVDSTRGYKCPVIVGEGPCGLFAGLVLAEAGAKPIIIERGDIVDNRVEKVEKFWATGELDAETNVQYGEGGAGTFSDGKLNTLVKDKTGKNQFVLDTFVKYGADPQIAYDAKPHIGTDVLRDVVANIRNRIIECGGQVLNLCKLSGLSIEGLTLKTITIDNMSGTERELVVSSDAGTDEIIVLKPGENSISVDSVILALGHSSRDTFKLLYDNDLSIEQKNFAIGLRIQHSQKMIDDSQYGKGHSQALPPSPYKVTNHTSNGRDVFSFCMCPGGYVVNASSKDGYTCVNGMSYSDRASRNANSALIVAIDREDFLDDHPLAGMFLQEKLEKTAYELGNGKIPVQLFGDYENNIKSSSFCSIAPVFKGDTEFVNIREILPSTINEAIIESINKFGYTIEGFNDKDAILAAIESRTSSPVRIKRDENLESNIKGIFPAGEGAGYAGGIMSAAMDGIRVADSVLRKYMS